MASFDLYQSVLAGSANHWSSFKIFVLNALQGTTSGETAEVSVYMWCDNIQFLMPNAQSGKEISETRNTATPKVSTIVGSVSQAFGALSNVPLIGPYAKTLSWVGDVTSKSLNMIGFSKPISDAPRTTTSLVPARGYTNVKGVDQSVVLGFDPQNSVDPDPALVSMTNDDMDLYTFLSREQYITTFNWPATSSIDSVLYSEALDVCNYPNTILSQTAQNFNYWRGSLIMRLSFVKNAFYSGRLAIRWFPRNSGTSATSPNVPTIYVDVKESREIVFRIPHSVNTPVLPCDIAAGTLVIYVVNPLRALDTMPQTVPCYLSWCVGSDFMFSMADNIQITRAQSGPIPQTQIGNLESRAIDLLSGSKTSMNNELVSIGEVITSLRPLLQRSQFALSITQSYRFDTAWFGLVNSYIPLEYYSYFFRFYRGSRRYKFFVRRFPTTAYGVLS